MKAMIFAAGLGTRLRPLTDHQPKALVPIAGKSMLERTILKLKEAGFNDITINIHHFGEQILEYLKNNHNFGVTIHISDERKTLLDTGGGVLHARSFLDGNKPILIHNVDILSDIDLNALYQYHINNQAEATLAISDRQTSRYLIFDKQNRLNGWINKTTGEIKPNGFKYDEDQYHPMAFAGIHVISPSLFEHMRQKGWQGKFSIISFYLSVCAEKPLFGWPIANVTWFDIGKPDSLTQAESYLLQKENVTKM